MYFQQVAMLTGYSVLGLKGSLRSVIIGHPVAAHHWPRIAQGVTVNGAT